MPAATCWYRRHPPRRARAAGGSGPVGDLPRSEALAPVSRGGSAGGSMSQIFHPSTNTIARVSIFGLVFFVAFVGWVAMMMDRSTSVTRERHVFEQPVPFSH